MGSTATPYGSLNDAAAPAPSAEPPPWPAVPAKVVTTFGARLGLVEYSKEALVVVPSRLTVPLSVAIVPVTLVAASVMTAGGLASWVRSSSPSSRGRPEPRADGRR